MPATRVQTELCGMSSDINLPLFTEIHSMTTNNLANFDFQILIDTSGSMGSNDAVAG